MKMKPGLLKKYNSLFKSSFISKNTNVTIWLFLLESLVVMNKLLETTSGEVNVCVYSQSHITPTWWRKGKMKYFCLNSIEYIQWWLGEDRCSIYQTISNAHIIVGFSTLQLISSTKIPQNLEYVLNFTHYIGWSHSLNSTFCT